MEELGYGRRMDVHAAVVEDFDLLVGESVGVYSPLHDVDVAVAFWWYDIFSVQLDFEGGFIESVTE
jgi:hypothetical protein